MNEILRVTRQENFIDCQNDKGETPLFKTIFHGHLNCLQTLLTKGANHMKITLSKGVNVLHVAAENGRTEILKYLLLLFPELININTAEGFCPIHLAVLNNHADCVHLLLSEGADIKLKTAYNLHESSTPLHIAALKNHVGIAEILIEKDPSTIHELNNVDWSPLHSAGHHGNRDVITLLLAKGADLAGYTSGSKELRKTAINEIINNIPKPADFMEEIFDFYITSNYLNMNDPNCEVAIDYRILMPGTCTTDQMKVMRALINTGNRYEQMRLLVHPLVESFLHLKWKALLPFFYTIIAIYCLFVMSLTTFSVSVFFYNDTDNEPPTWLNPYIWVYFVYVTITLLFLQVSYSSYNDKKKISELICCSANPLKFKSYKKLMKIYIIFFVHLLFPSVFRIKLTK